MRCLIYPMRHYCQTMINSCDWCMWRSHTVPSSVIFKKIPCWQKQHRQPSTTIILLFICFSILKIEWISSAKILSHKAKKRKKKEKRKLHLVSYFLYWVHNQVLNFIIFKITPCWQKHQKQPFMTVISHFSFSKNSWKLWSSVCAKSVCAC